MDFEFVVADQSRVDVLLADDLPILQEALSDSLGTRPPRGAPQDGPSTYWIDRAIARLQARLEDAQEDPFASGNTTYLALKQRVVEARYDYDEVDSDYVDVVPPQALLDLLKAWREKVLDADPDAASRMPSPQPARPLSPPS